MKIAYASSVRIPTEKAHGVQILRMCEAFASLGAESALFHPHRHQPDRKMRNVDPFEQYDLKHRFAIHTVRNLDIYRFMGITPRWLFRPMSVAHSMIWERYLARTARNFRASLYMVRDATPIAAMSLATSGYPTVIEFHEEQRGVARRALRKAVHGKGFLFAIAVTSYLADEVREAYDLPSEKVRVLPDGVDPERFPGPTPSHQTNEPPVVMYLGSLLENRGVRTLVESSRLLPEVKVKIVGGLPEQIQPLRELADTYGVGNVVFIGQIPYADVPQQLQQADIVVLPMTGSSRHTAYRASPMKLFEYMAAGKAIVVSDLPSIREVVKHGENAWLVKSDSPESLADGVRYLLAHPDIALSLGTRARQAAGQYTWKSRAENILDGAGLLDSLRQEGGG